MRYPLLFLFGILSSVYVIVLLVQFVLRSLAFLLILPLKMYQGDYLYDFSPSGKGQKRSFWAWIYCIYAYEMRGDLIWEVIYDQWLRAGFRN